MQNPLLQPPQLPPEQLAQHLGQLRQQQRQQQAASDKQLLQKVLDQGKAGWPVLKWFTVDVAPRAPFTVELTHYPPRSRYYETFVCTWTFIFSIVLLASLEYCALRSRLGVFLRNQRALTALQFALLVVPFQISVLDFPVKSYVNFVLPFNAACLLVWLGCLVHRRFHRPGTAAAVRTDPEQPQQQQSDTPATERRPPFNDLLSIYRSVVYISTAVCIFARDQPCWNNAFSKSYSFGTGLMDIGIGCFIVCIGSLGPTAGRRLDQVDRRKTLRKAALQAAILSACGLVKTVSVLAVAAVKGVTFDATWREYGVHWNAFYSLAVARLLGATLELLALPRWAPPLLAAAAVAAAHEAALAAGLAELVLAPGAPEPHNRAGLIGQNREGLASVPGLLTLYLAGLQLGRWAREWSDSGGGPRVAASAKMLALLVASLAVRLLVLSGPQSPQLVLPESRRLMNPAYCAWVVAFSCFCLLCSCLVLMAKMQLLLLPGLPASGTTAAAVTVAADAASAQAEPLTPLHLRQVDSAGLLYFLVSNLLTGVFNFLIDRAVRDRESLDGPACFVIILVYMAVTYCCTRAAETWLSFRLLQEKLMRTCCST